MFRLPYQANGHTYCTNPDGQRFCTGAMMGRAIDLPRETTAKLHLHRVRLDNGGYDPGGAYWGIGQPLYCAWNDDGEAAYVRASDRAAAKAMFPNARWFR